MSFTDELTKLADEKKWYEFGLSIESNLPKQTKQSEIDSVLSLFSKYISKIHPLSLKTTTLAFFPILDGERFVKLVENVISIIVSVSISDDAYAQEIITLNLYKSISLIKRGILENIESQIFSLRASDLSNENTNLLYLVAALFYEKIGNIEEAQHNLFLHAKLTNAVYDIEKLIYLSLLSKNFFDFAAISSFKEFEDFNNKSLKNVFISFQEGSIKEKEVLKVLKIDNISYIKDKVYILNIMKTCFESEQKFVAFDRILTDLGIDEKTLIRLLLKALGLKVIRGWIDSEQRMLFFDSVLPRALCKDELDKMKFKFVEWRKRVQMVIDVIEQC